MPSKNRIHVAAAVIRDSQERVLLSLRPGHVHQGGLWEFPGGKLENQETIEEGLHREIQEELGIQIRQARPLIRIQHDYSDRSVLLDVWQVEAYQGEPQGLEGQALEWVQIADLSSRPMPAADVPIVNAIKLPEFYMITPDYIDRDVFLSRLEQALVAGIRLVQLRAKQLDRHAYAALSHEVTDLCHRYQAKALLNIPVEWLPDCTGDGLHLSSQRLMQLHERPVHTGQWLAASCHTQGEIERANEIGVDFIVLSPVLATPSHPNASPMGWDSFSQLTDSACMPVYALGGLRRSHLASSFVYGAQGIAGIRAFWESESV